MHRVTNLRPIIFKSTHQNASFNTLMTDVLGDVIQTGFLRLWRGLETEKGGNAQSDELKTDHFEIYASKCVI